MKQSKEAGFYSTGFVREHGNLMIPYHARLGGLNGPLRFGLNDHDVDRFVKLGISLHPKRRLGEKGIPTPKARDVRQREAFAKL